MHKIEIILHKGFYPTTEVRDFIAVICRRWGFTSRHAYQIKTAVDEALTNIIQHAYKNGQGMIKLQISYNREKMKIIIRDRGKPLEQRPRTTPVDLVIKKKDRGLGLVLIERLMDKVKRIRRKNYNELVMEKTRTGAR